MYLMGVGLGCGWCGNHGPPTWRCWWTLESWVSHFLGLSIVVYISVLSTWCQGGMGTCLLHPFGTGNHLRVQKAKSGQGICNPGSFPWEEVLSFYLSTCDTGAPQNPLKNRSWEPHVSGEPLILPMETAAHSVFLLGAWGMRHGSLQLECLPHWRITHSVWAPARSRMAGCCLTGLVLLLQVQICESWHTPCPYEQQSPSRAAKHAGDQECPPFHLAFGWGHLIHGQGQIHRMSLVAVSCLWPGRGKKGEKTKTHHLMVLASSFLKLVVSALGTRQ